MALRGGWQKVSVLAAPVLSAMLLISAGVGPPVAHADSRSETDRATTDAVTAAAAPVGSAARRSDVKADLNGDGYSDLVVGGTVLGATTVGWSVSVIYGGRGGLVSRGNQLWHERLFGQPAGDSFVGDLATGDFDGDGFVDLAIGIKEAIPRVRIIYGSARGLSKERSQVWLPSVVDGMAPDDDDETFGAALSTGNFGRSKQDDLAIGSSEWGGGRGAVILLYGSKRGLTRTGAQTWTQDTRGVPGVGGRDNEFDDGGDEFGAALAAGLLAGGRYAALAIGVPGEGSAQWPGGPAGPGAVNVLYGSAAGLTARGADLWSKFSRGIKSRAEEYGFFGLVRAVGHFSGRASADLAIADVRGEVNVIRGSSRGLTAAGDQLWSARSLRRGGRKFFDSEFATSMTVGIFGGDSGKRRFDDLALGGAAEVGDEEDPADTGSALVLYGSSNGLKLRHRQIWRWDSPEVQGSSGDEGGDEFAELVTAGGFVRSGYDELAVADWDMGAGSNLRGRLASCMDRRVKD